MMEKRNIVEPIRTPRHELKSKDDDLYKIAVAKFKTINNNVKNNDEFDIKEKKHKN